MEGMEETFSTFDWSEYLGGMASPAIPETVADNANDKDQNHVTRLQMFKTRTPTEKMRILSEAALDEVAPWYFEPGTAYHFISAGDVDSLTFLRHILKQQRARYVLVSTWCMVKRDAEEMRSWLDRGMVGRFDYYVGEVFKRGYRGCLDVLEATAAACGGRVARFRNHSKLMVILGEEWDAVIESSANVDTNPRTEQTCITVGDTGLAHFYLDYFDKINDFDGRFKEWTPFER